MDRNIFTTNQVAMSLGLSAGTINKMFAQGKIQGYRVPFSKHKRFTREAIIAFAKEFGLPAPNFAAVKPIYRNLKHSIPSTS